MTLNWKPRLPPSKLLTMKGAMLRVFLMLMSVPKQCSARLGIWSCDKRLPLDYCGTHRERPIAEMKV
jgi:hypothetical protein